MTVKKIGFIDYFLDEWHANNHPAWMRDDIAAGGRAFEVAYAWADTEPNGKTDSRTWCEQQGMTLITSIEELVEQSDCLAVLSPDNPEHHERLSAPALRSGKPVFIDKTFSPDLSSGIRIFDLAERHHTPVFSSSALRFALELSGFPDAKFNRDSLESVSTTGPGTYEIYSVHQMENIIQLMGPAVRRVKSLSTPHTRMLIAEYETGRYAYMTQAPALPFQIYMQASGEGKSRFIPTCSEFFPRQIHAILDFFETGNPPVPREDTLAVMALREAGFRALAEEDTWIEVGKF